MSIKIQPKNPQQVGTPSSTDPKMSGEVTIIQNGTMIHMKTRQRPQCHTCRLFSTKIHANAVVDVVWGSKSSCEGVQWYKKVFSTLEEIHIDQKLLEVNGMSQTVLNFQVIEASANESAGHRWHQLLIDIKPVRVWNVHQPSPLCCFQCERSSKKLSLKSCHT